MHLQKNLAFLEVARGDGFVPLDFPPLFCKALSMEACWIFRGKRLWVENVYQDSLHISSIRLREFKCGLFDTYESVQSAKCSYGRSGQSGRFCIVKILNIGRNQIRENFSDRLLRFDHYSVDHAADGESGLLRSKDYDYDLVILDISELSIDGVDLCQQLRTQNAWVPILVLASHHDSHYKAQLLNAGADDCVEKIVSGEELVARVNSLLRRTQQLTHPSHPQELKQNGDEKLKTNRQPLRNSQPKLGPKNEALIKTQQALEQEQERATHLQQQVAASEAGEARIVEEMQAIEAQFERLATNVPGMILQYVLYPDGDEAFTYVSSGCRDIFGQEPEDLLRNIKLAWEVTHPEDVGWVRQTIIQSAQQLERFDVEFRVSQPGGTLKWIRAISSPHRQADGRVVWDGLMLDITARKQLEQSLENALTTSEAKLNRIVDSAIASICSFRLYANQDLEYEYWSAGCEKLFGYTLAELLDKPLWFSKVVPEDLENVVLPLYEDFYAERDVTAEYRFRRKDGELRWILGAYSSTQMTDNCWIVTAVLQDITERKHAELALQDSEAKNRALLAAMPDLMIRVDGNGIYREILDAGCNFEVLARNAVGKSMADVLSADVAERAFYYLREALGTGEMQVFEQQISLGNRIQYEEVRVIKSGDDEVLFIIRDITDRRQFEFALQDSHQRYITLTEAVPVAIFRFNAAGECVYVNERWSKMTGRPPKAAMGMEWLKTIHPEDQEATLESWQQWAQAGQPGRPYRSEARILRPDGQIVWFYGLILPEIDAEGSCTGYIGSLTDITAKKQLEAQFYQAQRMESLGRLASGIAHDLNNVLTPILILSQMLRTTQTSLTASAQEQLQLIESSARRGAELVKQVLTTTRASQGEPTVIDLIAVLEEVVNIAQKGISKAIHIQSNFLGLTADTPSLASVLADPTRMHQVFMNLCINACDAMPHGGTLTITAENTYVDEATAQQNLDAQVGPYVMVSVTDTGTGIEPAVRDRIFEPFFTTKETGKGSGLGLATVFSIVKNSGGFLQVSSEVGRGTRFRVFLPAINGVLDPLNDEKSDLDVALSVNEAFILIVDDDAIVQQTTQALLDSYHYNTLAVSNGFEAIECYTQRQDQIQLIILDITMPQMDGIELIGKLKAINPALNIIAISGLQTNREPALAAGASIFMEKPYDLESLLAEVRNLEGTLS